MEFQNTAFTLAERKSAPPVDGPCSTATEFRFYETTRHCKVQH
jgi:hypothetical protein